jgi:hypothetical protein
MSMPYQQQQQQQQQQLSSTSSGYLSDSAWSSATLRLVSGGQVSISPMVYAKLLRSQIQKAQKYSKYVNLFCTFGI